MCAGIKLRSVDPRRGEDIRKVADTKSFSRSFSLLPSVILGRGLLSSLFSHGPQWISLPERLQRLLILWQDYERAMWVGYRWDHSPGTVVSSNPKRIGLRRKSVGPDGSRTPEIYIFLRDRFFRLSDSSLDSKWCLTEIWKYKLTCYPDRQDRRRVHLLYPIRYAFSTHVTVLGISIHRTNYRGRIRLNSTRKKVVVNYPIQSM